MDIHHRFVKKLGAPHPATIQIDLTEDQCAERRKKACDLRDQQAALADEKKLAMAGFNQRKKALENEEATLRQQASSCIEVAAVVVQNYLTATNEVVAIRIDNGEAIARRTATGEELQEEMFGGEASGKPS